ncbi:GNAT family N-acetyltransferase [Streptococcus ovuberis]|uniref:GNAT family N-acetyltransferase n=1 Tax=Streptococcus ovuberis TaxID=1936207 RepID=A0A7X6N041_9STRE|nr:GNAT family N-acetyltransferase [Streptococcus ovuberis]NKZ19599.1 GNAT family N-acetyltransferase [Streptococcus ovuberis]
MICFKPFTYAQETLAIRQLYESVSWTNYLGNDEALERAFENSLYLLGAFKEQTLVGFIRCIGDGEPIVVIQDLLVHPDHQKQGIGRTLLKKIWDHYSHVRQLQLNTDLNDATANQFYRNLGMKSLQEGQLIAYFRQSNNRGN